MNRPNQDHVAIQNDLDCRWGFLFPVTATTCGKQVEEVSEIVSLLFETFDDYIIPQTVVANVQAYPAGTTVPKSMDDTSSRLETSDITLSVADGISTDELISSFHSKQEAAPFVGRVTFEQMAVNIRLESGDVYINGDGPSAEYVKGKQINTDPSVSPLSIELTYFPAHTQDEIESESMYYLKIATKTDIWFEETEIGQTNANRLSDFLKRVGDRLPVKSVVRDTNWSVPLTDIY